MAEILASEPDAARRRRKIKQIRDELGEVATSKRARGQFLKPTRMQ